jgi:hypothetical protein
MMTTKKITACWLKFLSLKGLDMGRHCACILLTVASLGLLANADVYAEPGGLLLKPIPRVQVLKQIPPATDTQTVPITLPDIDRWYAPHTNGDLEFAGHGPSVWLDGKLDVINDRVVMRVHMKAQETASNWSMAEGTVEKEIYKAPSGFKILRVEGPTNWAKNYTAKNHEPELIKTPWGVVICYGDHPGEDILYYTGLKTMFTYQVPIVIQRVH